jgi:hypothetical protein
MRFQELVKNAWQVAVSAPALWLAAAIQLAAVFALSVKLEGLYTEHTGQIGTMWLLALALFSLASAWLWKTVQSRYYLSVRNETFVFKWSVIAWVRLFLLSVLVFGVMLGARLAEIGWLTSVVVGALVIPTAVVCALGLVLLNLNFTRGARLALDFWSLKSTVPAFAALSFMILHGWAFALARNTYRFLGFWEGFSESIGFGTIWSLALWLVWGLGIVGSFLNTFLVFGFLEILKTKDTGVKKEETITKPVPAIQ